MPSRTRHLATKAREATVLLLRAADSVRVSMNSVVEPFGITGQQYNVLSILRGAGPAGLPTLTIIDRMVEHAPGITRMVDRLTAKKLVVRDRRDKDRRRVHVFLTKQGLEILGALEEPVSQANRAAFETLSRAELVSLCEMLGKCRPEPIP